MCLVVCVSWYLGIVDCKQLLSSLISSTVETYKPILLIETKINVSVQGMK